MKKRIAALSVSLALSTLPLGAFAHGYDAGDAALGGFVGGVVGGLIGPAAFRSTWHRRPSRLCLPAR